MALPIDYATLRMIWWGLVGIVLIGFDALPEALAKVRDGELTATIEQFPGKQSAIGVERPARPTILIAMGHAGPRLGRARERRACLAS